MSQITVTEFREIPASTVARIGKTDVMITYMVDNARQYSLIMPKEEATPEAVTKRISDAERERLKII